MVHLYKQKEERVLCEKKLVNKPEIHQSMETNIKKMSAVGNTKEESGVILI